MSIFDDIKHLFEKAEKDIGNFAEDIDHDLKRAKDAVNKALQEVEKRLEQGIEDAEHALIRGIVDKLWKDPAVNQALQKVKATLQAIDASGNNASLADDVTSIFTKPDHDKTSALLSHCQWGQIDQIHGDVANAGCVSMSGGIVGEVDVGVGLAGAAAAAVNFKSGELRMLVEFAVSGGVEEGADAGVSMGIWKRSPSDLRGAFVAAGVEGAFEAGVGLLIYLELPSLDFLGAVVVLLGGEEVELALEFGYTLPFKFPKAAGV